MDKFNVEVLIEHPLFDKHPEKSKTNNSEWRVCLMVKFSNMLIKDGVGHWLPTDEQIKEINAKRAECEQRNKMLCKEKNNRGVENGTESGREVFENKDGLVRDFSVQEQGQEQRG
jgi:hypothetical protein